jgi:hypothetical protein
MLISRIHATLSSTCSKCLFKNLCEWTLHGCAGEGRSEYKALTAPSPFAKITNVDRLLMLPSNTTCNFYLPQRKSFFVIGMLIHWGITHSLLFMYQHDSIWYGEESKNDSLLWSAVYSPRRFFWVHWRHKKKFEIFCKLPEIFLFLDS